MRARKKMKRKVDRRREKEKDDLKGGERKTENDRRKRRGKGNADSKRLKES